MCELYICDGSCQKCLIIDKYENDKYLIQKYGYEDELEQIEEILRKDLENLENNTYEE